MDDRVWVSERNGLLKPSEVRLKRVWAVRTRFISFAHAGSIASKGAGHFKAHLEPAGSPLHDMMEMVLTSCRRPCRLSSSASP